MSKKNLKYKPTGKFIGIETGFIQAATLLDIAATSALESRDFELVAQIASKWMELSLTMKNVLPKSEMEEEEEEDPHQHHHKAAPVGFGVTAQEIKDYNARNKPSSKS